MDHVTRARRQWALGLIAMFVVSALWVLLFRRCRRERGLEPPRGRRRRTVRTAPDSTAVLRQYSNRRVPPLKYLPRVSSDVSRQTQAV
jgi:hypothetical protein